MDPMTHELQIQAAVYRARLKVRESHLTKRADNPYFNSKYIPYEDIHQVVTDALAGESLVYYQNVSHDGVNSVVVEHFVQTPEGHKLKVGETKLPTPKMTPQDAGSAFSYAKRYGAGALFGIIETKDDDCEGAQKPHRTQSKPQPVATPPVVKPVPREGTGWDNPTEAQTVPESAGEMMIKGKRWVLSEMNYKQLGTVAYTGAYLKKHEEMCSTELLRRVAKGDKDAIAIVDANSQP